MIDGVFYNIKIEPILTNGFGKYLTLTGLGAQIDHVEFQIAGTTQKTILNSQGEEILYFPYGDNSSLNSNQEIYNPIVFDSINVNNNILNPTGQSHFTFKINDNNGENIFANPFLDLFRENDIVRIYYYTSNNTELQQIFVGSIENININSSIRGTPITVTMGQLPNILERSQLVQTQSNAVIGGGQLTSLTNQLYQLGNFITTLLNETYIHETVTNVLYYGGITNGVSEQIASGKASPKNPTATKGSALNASSYVYAYTPPTMSKLDCILQILYPFQRIFYVDPAGNFNITPLTTFFDEVEDWTVDIFGDPSSIPLLDINVSKNTALLQNRAFNTLMQLTVEFNQSTNFGTPGQANAAQSIATPPAKYFPRAYDLVASNEGLQTSFTVQTLDPNAILQNSGILNSATLIANNKIVGMRSVMNIDNANASINSINSNFASFKFLTGLYSARKLAENLTQDLLVDITMPTISTYSDNLGRLRKIPLNQMVQLPSVNNNNFDGLNQMFCYGFSLSWSNGQGSITKLSLCKPYVFTALWCDSLVQI